MLTETIDYYLNMQFAEILAAITALAYVIFAARGSLWCWPAAMISTVLYSIIFYDVYLWSDSGLQIYYFSMAIYGWWNWKQSHCNQEDSQNNFLEGTLNSDREGFKPQKNHTIMIQTYHYTYHLKALGILTLISLALGYLMSNYTPTDFPYLDAATTAFAVFGTYLVAQRVLENWLYWVVIDLVSIYLYIEKGLTPTAVLFGLYVILASYAYYNWRKLYHAQNNDTQLEDRTFKDKIKGGTTSL
jgi:nicotinamide mononucleotide transporter